MARCGQSEAIMMHPLSGRFRPLWLAAIASVAALGGVLAGFSPASAQAVAPDSASKQQILRAASAKTPLVTSGSGAYYIEFRSRYSWDYGHTYIVYGRVGETPTKNSVAGLSPVGDDATAWVVGHYVPVPAETGWTDGDLEDKYITSRYRVLMDKDHYDRTLAHIKELQGRSHMWSAELYNCNAFVADIAQYMGLSVPSSTLIYPKIFVGHLRMLNTGHPDANDTLVSDNMKEMSSPTRDGRAMITNHIYTIGPDGQPHSAVVAGAPTSAPKVTIGALRVSNNKPSSAAAPSQ
jgi:hypothetical protein